MASIRKRGGKYHVQIRKTGYPALTNTFKSLTTAKRWASATEVDLERHLYVHPSNVTLEELLCRYEREVSPLHKSHGVEKYRIRTLKRHLGDQEIATLTASAIAKFRDSGIANPPKVTPKMSNKSMLSGIEPG